VGWPLDGQILARAFFLRTLKYVAAHDEFRARGKRARDGVFSHVLNGIDGIFGRLAEDSLCMEIVKVVHGREKDILVPILG